MTDIIKTVKKRISNYDFCEKIFYAAFILFFISVALTQTGWNIEINGQTSIFTKILKYVRYFAYLLWAIELLYIFYQIKFKEKLSFNFIWVKYREKLIVYGCVTAIVLLSCLFARTTILGLYLLMFFAAYKMNSKKIVSITLIIQVTLLALLLILTQTHIITDFVSESGTRDRHFLGYFWTTDAPFMWFFILCEYFYIKDGKCNLLELIIGEAVSVYLYLMTDTKSALIVSTILIVYVLLKKYISFAKIENKILDKILIIMPSFLCLSSVLFLKFVPLNTRFWSLVNEKLSNRIWLSQNGFNLLKVTPFGQKMTWVGFNLENVCLGQPMKGAYNYVDCSYLQVLFENGLFALLLIVIAYTILIKCEIKSKNYLFCGVLELILLLCIVDPKIINFAYNPFLIICLIEIRNKKYSLFNEVKHLLINSEQRIKALKNLPLTKGNN